MALSLYAELHQFFTELEQQPYPQATTPTLAAAPAAAALVSSLPDSTSPAEATEAPSAEGSDQTDKTAQTSSAQAGSALAAVSPGDQTAPKLRANPTPLPPAPSAAPPLPPGTVPILPTPCAVCGASARFATRPGTPVCPDCWARAREPQARLAEPGEARRPPQAKAHPEFAAEAAPQTEPEEPEEPEDDRPWWERGAEPPCYVCGQPAGNGRDQWARPLCLNCWFDLPQRQQMLASMPGDASPSGEARVSAAWRDLLLPAQDAAAVEEACWLCGNVVEDYDPAGNAWCEDCLRGGRAHGWQDLLDALPECASDQREREGQRLAVYAAAAYHVAGRPKLWLDSWHIGTGESLQGVEVFAWLGAALAGDDMPARREARQRLKALATSSGRSLRRL